MLNKKTRDNELAVERKGTLKVAHSHFNILNPFKNLSNTVKFDAIAKRLNKGSKSGERK